MHYRRLGVGLAVVNRLMYAVGGFDGNDRLRTCECYHPENNEWTIIPPMKTGRSGAGLCENSIQVLSLRFNLKSFSFFFVGVAALNQFIYVVGGFDGTRQLACVERYDTEHGVWDSVASISIARSALSVTSLDGRLYAMGGFDGFNFLSIVEVYDPELNLWEKGPELTTGRSGHASAVIYKPSGMLSYMDCQENEEQEKREETKTTQDERTGQQATVSSSMPGGECSRMHTVDGSRCNVCNDSPDAIHTASIPSTRSILPLAATGFTSTTRPFAELPSTVRQSVVESTTPTTINNSVGLLESPNLAFSAILAVERCTSPSLNDKKRVRVHSFNSTDVIPPKCPAPRDEHAGQQVDRDDPRKFRRLYDLSPALRYDDGACSSGGQGRISSSPSGSYGGIQNDSFSVPSTSTQQSPSTSSSAMFKIHSSDQCSVKALKNNLQRRLRALVSGNRRYSQTTKAIADSPHSPNSPQSSSSQDEDMDT